MNKTLYVNYPDKISDVISSIPKNNTESISIYISEGIYKEKLIIDRPYITLIGESKDKTIITYNNYANETMPDGSKYHTFRTYSVLVDTHDFTAKNLTISNTSGTGKEIGQAIALYADGDRLVFDNCNFLGYQDTLFTGPLPEKEYEPNGFLGPKQFSPRINGRQYYHNCYIEGTVDYIFGSATAYFENCNIHSLYRDTLNTDIQGWITAASTPEGQEYGYVLSNCTLTSDCPKNSVYLGRPWRDYAKTIYINCLLDEHIHTDGFHDWNKEHARKVSLYAEYNSTYKTGISVPKRADFVKTLTSKQLSYYSKENVLKGNDNWTPIL